MTTDAPPTSSRPGPEKETMATIAATLCTVGGLAPGGFALVPQRNTPPVIGTVVHNSITGNC